MWPVVGAVTVPRTRESDTMSLTSSRTRIRVRIAAIAIAALALLLPAAPAALAAGLRNCVDVPLAQAAVWAAGKMSGRAGLRSG